MITEFKIFEYETTGKKEDEIYEVVGLPSGQVIYMTKKQVRWFNSRGLIMYITRYKKMNPPTLNKFCFDDMNYEKIQEYLNVISW